MAMVHLFKCDICNTEYRNKDENGNALPIGGVTGGIMQGEGETCTMMVIDLDFCEKHWMELINYIKEKQHEFRNAA